MSNTWSRAREYKVEAGCCGLLVLAVLIVFHRVLDASLLPWDDNINLYRNPNFGGLSWERLHWMFTDFQQTLRYKPLSWLTWSLIYDAGKFNPFSYHLANLLFHVVNTCLLFGCFRSLAVKLMSNSAFQAQKITVLACCTLGTLTWALHPLRVEPVAWATGLPYGQSIFFVLISFLFYLRAHADAQLNSFRRPSYWLSIVAYLAALLTYPTVLGFPVVLLLVDHFLLHRFVGEGISKWWNKASRRVWLEKLPYLAFAGLLVAFTLYNRIQNPGNWNKAVTLEEFGLFPRAMQAFYILAYYVWHSGCPTHLCPVYTQLTHFDPATWPFLLSAVFVIVVTVALFIFRRRWPWAFALWCAYIALLVPVLGFTEHPHYPSDRYSALAGICLSALIAILLWKCFNRVAIRKAAVAGSLMVLTVLSCLSFEQTEKWQNSFVFFDAMLQELGNDSYAHFVHYLVGQEYSDAGDFVHAEQHLRLALAWHPTEPTVPHALAYALYQQEKTDEALVYVRESIRRNPAYMDGHMLAGGILYQLGRLDEAATEYRAQLTIKPDHQIALIDLGIIAAAQGNPELAISWYKKAVLPTPASIPPPQHIGFFEMMARAYAQAGNKAAAEKMIQNALSLAKSTGNPGLEEDVQRHAANLPGPKH